MAQKSPEVRSAAITQEANGLGRQIMRVLLAAFRFITVDPIGDYILKISPSALGEDYTEALRGHRS